MMGLLKKLLSLFKRKPKPIPPPVRTEQEIANDKHRAKYRLEYLENVYFVQYHFNGDWWFLRRWDDDYILEERRGMGLRITDQNYLEDVITKHQEWLAGGRFFMAYKYDR